MGDITSTRVDTYPLSTCVLIYDSHVCICMCMFMCTCVCASYSLDGGEPRRLSARSAFASFSPREAVDELVVAHDTPVLQRVFFTMVLQGFYPVALGQRSMCGHTLYVFFSIASSYVTVPYGCKRSRTSWSRLASRMIEIRCVMIGWERGRLVPLRSETAASVRSHLRLCSNVGE